MGLAQRPDAGKPLGSVRCGEALNGERDRPNLFWTGVGRAYALRGPSREPPGIAGRQDPAPRREVARVAGAANAQTRQRAEARGVGVVHAQHAAEAIDFISPEA